MALSGTPLPNATNPNAIVVTGTGTAALETIFDPALNAATAGKRWRLLGWQIFNGTVDTANVIFIADNNTVVRSGICALQTTGAGGVNVCEYSTPIGHVAHESAANNNPLKMQAENTKVVQAIFFIQVY